jgi:hypothetical protein
VHVYSSWGTSRAIAIGIVVVAFGLLFLLGLMVRRNGSRYGGLVNGLDNRWSTSKVAIVLWTAAIVWAFITLLVRYRGSAIPSSVPGAYFALLGIPSAGALGAKAITSSQASGGSANGSGAAGGKTAGGKTSLSAPTVNPLKGVAQVFSDDTGSADLLDSQYFLFNLVLLGYFVASFFHIAEPKAGSTDIILPALPGSLLALAGVSAATYLGKKGLTGATNQIAAGASLQVTADSDVQLPGGGTITLNSSGAVTIYPGVTYTSQSAGTAQTATGGQLQLTTEGQLELASGATITGPPGAQIGSLGDATVLVGSNSPATDPNSDPAPDAPAGGKQLVAGGRVLLAAGEGVIVASDGARFALPAGCVVAYVGAGKITVLDNPVGGTISAGATLGHLEQGAVEFPTGASYVDATNPGPAQRAQPSDPIQLNAEVPGKPAQSIILVESAPTDLSPKTTITFPAAPTPVGAGVKTTATTQTTINLPSGGTITIDPTDAGVAAHVPNGTVVAVPAGQKPATVTATISTT